MTPSAGTSRDAAANRPTTAPGRALPAERLPYAPPSVVAYGRVDELTRTVGRRGRRDSRGRGGGRRRTGF